MSDDTKAGDDAAMKALCHLTFTEGKNEPFCLNIWKCDEGMTAARVILAAIRDGRVPGVYCGYGPTVKEIHSLRAKLDESNYWRTNYAQAVKDAEKERDAAIARAERAEAERDAFKARYAEVRSGFDKVLADGSKAELDLIAAQAEVARLTKEKLRISNDIHDEIQTCKRDNISSVISALDRIESAMENQK